MYLPTDDSIFIDGYFSDRTWKKLNEPKANSGDATIVPNIASLKVPDFRGYASGIIISPERKFVVLIKKNRPAWQKGCYNFPGGKIELGEHPNETVVREVREETGLVIPESKWDPVCINMGIKGEAPVYFYSTFTDAVFDAKTKTDEVVQCMYLDSFMLGKRPTLPNFSFVLSLALDTSGIVKPLTFWDDGRMKEMNNAGS